MIAHPLRAARDRGKEQKRDLIEAADAERISETPGADACIAALDVTDAARLWATL